MARILYIGSVTTIEGGYALPALLHVGGHAVDVVGSINMGRDIIPRGGYDIVLIANTTDEPGEAVRLAEQLADDGHKVRLIADEETQSDKVVCLDASQVQSEPGYLSYHVMQALQARKTLSSGSRDHSLIALPKDGLNLETLVDAIQKDLIEQALIRARFIRTHAAELLGMNFRSIRHLIKKLKIDVRKLRQSQEAGARNIQEEQK
jgi:hypothetical protein